LAENQKYELSTGIERYLAALSKLYAQDGKRELQQLIVNAQIRVAEGWSYDNWNGGTYGHAVYLTIPDALFMPIAKDRDQFQKEIAQDLNNLHNVQNEFIAQIFIEMEFSDDGEWRKESGLQLATNRAVSREAAKRVWEDDSFRIFLSHKSEVKRETAALKTRLQQFGASAFVAHEDIHPTKEWQDEIENALATMDAFVALMTDQFHDSDWTDQEVGYALARGVPIIAVRLGRNPYGFLGKFQGLSSDWNSAAQDIVKLLINREQMISAYIRALRDCPNFDTGNLLSSVLANIQHLSTQQMDELIDAYNANGELRGSFGFSGTKPFVWGDGLIPHLHRLGPRRFTMDANWPRLIEPATAVSVKKTKTTQRDEIKF
jgi:TIR domain